MAGNQKLWDVTPLSLGLENAGGVKSKENESQKQFAELPEEAVFNILSRIDKKSLARSECVCKEWRLLINDPYIEKIRMVDKEPVPIRIEHIKPVSNSRVLCKLRFCPIIKCLKADNIPICEFLFSSLMNKYTRLGISSCEGLILISWSREDDSIDPTKLMVINPEIKTCHPVPSMKEWLVFPSRCEGVGICFDETTKAFMIVCIMKRSLLDKEELYTVVHYLGTSDVWLEIDQAPSECIMGEGVYTVGYLNWLLSYWDEVEPMRKLFRFNVETEKFETVMLPKKIGKMSVGEVCRLDHLVALNGKLGFACHNDVRGSQEVELWKLNEQEWVMHCKISEIPLIYKGIRVSGFLNSDEDVLLSTELGDLVVFCKKSGVFRRIEVEEEEHSHYTYTGIYRKSFWSISGLQNVPAKLRQRRALGN